MTTTTIPARTGRWSIPAGRVEIPAGRLADRDGWLETRRTGVTATDMRVLHGDGYADETVYQRWLDKTKPVDDRPARPGGDITLELGNMIEPVIAHFATRELGVEMRNVGLIRSRSNELLLASPDRNASDGGGAEFKHTSTFYLRNYQVADADYTNRDGWTLPPAWLTQVLWQLEVTGWTHMHVAALIGDRKRMTYWTVERDQHAQDTLVVLAEMFWWHVLEVEPPPLDWDTITEAAVKARYPQATADSVTPGNAAEVADWVHRYAALTAEIGPLEKEKKALGLLLKATAGDASEVLDPSGARLYQYVNRARSSVDADRLAADAGLDLDDYRTKTTYRALASIPKAVTA